MTSLNNFSMSYREMVRCKISRDLMEFRPHLYLSGAEKMAVASNIWSFGPVRVAII